MSKRNSREGKARRRAERETRKANRTHESDLVDVQAWGEFVGQAERGERLACGCDAHELLQHMLSDGRMVDGLEVAQKDIVLTTLTTPDETAGQRGMDRDRHTEGHR